MQGREVWLLVAEVAWHEQGMVLGCVCLVISCPDLLMVMQGGGVTSWVGLRSTVA